MILPPVIEGFLEGLRIKEERENDLPIEVNDLLALLKGFSRHDLSSILDSLMDLHHRRDPEDYKILQSHLEDHGNAVYEFMQGYRLPATLTADKKTEGL